jgi:ascorbate-specific PTS system EIIC-type component UlaA
MLVILPGLRKPSKELHVLYFQSVAHPERAAMGGYKRVMLPARTDGPLPAAIGGCAAFQDQPASTNNKESLMQMSDFQPLYELLYAIGEILTTTWGGRVLLGIAIGCLISRLAKA